MAGPTTMLGDGNVSFSCAIYDDNILGLKCFEGTDVSNIVGIQVVDMGNNHYLRSHPSSLTSRPHKNPAAYDAVTFEKFIERYENKPPREVYLCDGLHIADPPQGVRVVAFHPKDCAWQNGNMVPVVYIVNKKVAFELAVDQKIIGAHHFRFVGRDEDRILGPYGDIRVLLVVYVRQLPGNKSYAYYFSLNCIGYKNAEDSLQSTEGPLQALQQDKLTLGWCTLQVQGDLVNVEGQMMFNLATSLVVRDDMVAGIKSLRTEKEEKLREEAKRLRLTPAYRRERRREWMKIALPICCSVAVSIAVVIVTLVSS